jgi:hypothetical protein
MFKDNLEKGHLRYYQIAGVTIRVEADLPITDTTFQPKFKAFEADGPGEDTITISHQFSLPDLNAWNMGEEIYRRVPWVVYRKGPSWIYMGISGQGSVRIRDLRFRIWRQLSSLWGTPRGEKELPFKAPFFSVREGKIHLLAIANHDHTRARIYHTSGTLFRRGNLYSLTLFPTDQILLARVLAKRGGCYIHASGVIFEGNGLLFVGHSDTGKTTIVNMLQDKAEVLCDDRMIVRKWPGGFKVHGTWSHGDVSEVSAGFAPLKAVLFLQQAQENRLIYIKNRQEAIRRALACLVKPLVTTDWWDQMLTLVDQMAHEVPCYSLRFDKSGAVVSLLKDL